ncbi:MAG: hypothetical protein U0235_27345 [Polyangiaceae bacterium]
MRQTTVDALWSSSLDATIVGPVGTSSECAGAAGAGLAESW